MNSFNHYTLGSIGEWLMNTMAGIAGPSGTGRSFDLAPVPGPGVDWCAASQLTPLGPVRAEWRRGSAGIDYGFELPANAGGRVTLACPIGAHVWRDGAAAEPDRFVVRHGLRYALVDVGSGRYDFAVNDPA